MKNLYNKELEKIDLLTSNSDKLNHSNNILRSIFQTTALTLIDITLHLTDDYSESLPDLILRFYQPSDGLPIEVIDEVLPLIRSTHRGAFLDQWFMARDENESLAKRALEWVQFRNKFAHGSISKEQIDYWSTRAALLAKDAIDGLSDALPTKDQKCLAVDLGTDNIRVTTPLITGENCLVVTRIENKGGILKLIAQTLEWEKNREVKLEIESRESFFNLENLNPTPRFSLSEQIIDNDRHSFFHNVPRRQTSIFEGRKKEIENLREWLSDFDHRACLIYGDGGFGKTTIVLEFFNSIFDDKITLELKLPMIISYHTAKLTRWTDEGISHYKGISTVVEDGIREIMYCLQEKLDKSWFTTKGRALVDKIASELKKQNIDRNDILIIIDNAETLASSQNETNELGEYLNLVSRKICRLIVTSRRREFLAAYPIHISSLTEQEAVALTRKLANEYDAAPIKQAGDSTLRNATKTLLRKPLLIEVLVKYISRTGTSIENALDSIFKKSNDDLLEFLYEDAWARMSKADHDLFMCLVSLNCPLDSYSVGYACQELEMQHSEFQESLAQTYFANLTSFGNRYDLEIIELAAKFFKNKLSQLSTPEIDRIKLVAKNVSRRSAEREKIEKEYKADRVAEAFRNDYAKSAKIESDKKNYKQASDLFELATIEDPLNAYLYERYAFFSFSKLHDPQAAKQQVDKALEIDCENTEALLTGAIIYYSFGDIKRGDELIVKAEKNGKPKAYCELRIAISRYDIARKTENNKEAIEYLEQALRFIQSSEKNLNRNDGYIKKNKESIRKYKDKILAELARRKQRTAIN